MLDLFLASDNSNLMQYGLYFIVSAVILVAVLIFILFKRLRKKDDEE